MSDEASAQRGPFRESRTVRAATAQLALGRNARSNKRLSVDGSPPVHPLNRGRQASTAHNPRRGRRVRGSIPESLVSLRTPHAAPTAVWRVAPDRQCHRRGARSLLYPKQRPLALAVGWGDAGGRSRAADGPAPGAAPECRALATRRVNGLYAIEMDYAADLRHQCPTPLALAALARAADRTIPIVYRSCRTREEFLSLLLSWRRRYRGRYPILSVGGHGAPGVVSVGNRRSGVGEVALHEVIEAIAGGADGAWLHVASCEALALHGNRLIALRRCAGVVGLSGFQQPVGFVEAMALEALLYNRLCRTRLNARGRLAVVRYANTLRSRRGPFRDLGFIVQ